MSSGKPISFSYVDDHKCNLDGSVFDGMFVNMCCCQCVSHKKVKAHCWYVEHEPVNSCNCDQEMGFYVCTLFCDMDPSEEVAQISGTHGLCEGFRQRPKRETKEEES